MARFSLISKKILLISIAFIFSIQLVEAKMIIKSIDGLIQTSANGDASFRYQLNEISSNESDRYQTFLISVVTYEKSLGYIQGTVPTPASLANLTQIIKPNVNCWIPGVDEFKTEMQVDQDYIVVSLASNKSFKKSYCTVQFEVPNVIQSDGMFYFFRLYIQTPEAETYNLTLVNRIPADIKTYRTFLESWYENDYRSISPVETSSLNPYGDFTFMSQKWKIPKNFDNVLLYGEFGTIPFIGNLVSRSNLWSYTIFILILTIWLFFIAKILDIYFKFKEKSNSSEKIMKMKTETNSKKDILYFNFVTFLLPFFNMLLNLLVIGSFFNISSVPYYILAILTTIPFSRFLKNTLTKFGVGEKTIKIIFIYVFTVLFGSLSKNFTEMPGVFFAPFLVAYYLSIADVYPTLNKKNIKND